MRNITRVLAIAGAAAILFTGHSATLADSTGQANDLPRSISTSGDPMHAALLNAGTLATSLNGSYMNGNGEAGVAGISDPASTGLPQTVSTSGRPWYAAMLNAGTMTTSLDAFHLR